MALADEQTMQALLRVAGEDALAGIAQVDALLADHPEDARLHFLRASLLVGTRPIEAHAAFQRAVTLAPDFALARFQLGFFELTSGEGARAIATWVPLLELSEDHYLRRFAIGLTHLVHDRFAEAVAALREGIALNGETPPLNGDMQLLIAECEAQMGGASPAEASATSFLLDPLGGGRVLH
ncbi:MAG: tetratricopeptide repeat protein [Sphingomonas paucimobilis]